MTHGQHRSTLAAASLRSSMRGDDLETGLARETVRFSLFGAAVGPPALGRYRVLRRIGSGGMGAVYLAHDPRLDRNVAIKVLRDGPEQAGATERLLREARAIAKLQHPHVVAVYDADVDAGRVFIAMEFVEGRSLDAWAETPRDWRETVALYVQAGRGLEAAHAAGIVHRDFKPANVLVGADGRVRVADFGLATEGVAVSPMRAEPHGPVDESTADTVWALDGPRTVWAGTPPYMAPEHLIAGVADARSDQWAFCASLYETLFGQLPFVATTLSELRHAVVDRPPKLPDAARRIHAGIGDALLRGLSRQSRDRFASMGEVVDVLERALDEDAGPPTERQAPPEDAARWESLPSVEKFVRALPDGLHSFDRCSTRSSFVRVALARRPVDGAIPDVVRHALAHPAVGADEMPTVVARVLLLAIFDRHYRGVEPWREFHRGLVRSQLGSSLAALGMMQAVAGGAVNLVTRTWAACHPCAPMTVSTAGRGEARVLVRWPEGAYDELFPIEIEEFLRTCFETAGARVFEARPLETSAAHVDLLVVWR